MYTDQALFDEVSAEIKPTDGILRNVACSADLACKTDKFIHLLGKITDKGDQEQAVRNGVDELFDANKPEYLDPLLFALQSEPSLDPNLTKVAINELSGPPLIYTDNRTLYAKRFFDHPAVSAEDYSVVLYDSYRSNDPKHVLFHWLLTRADSRDLEEIRGNEWFSNKPFEYQKVMTKASPVDISKTRHEMGRQERAAIIQSAIGDLVAVVLVKLIAEYEGW